VRPRANIVARAMRGQPVQLRRPIVCSATLPCNVPRGARCSVGQPLQLRLHPHAQRRRRSIDFANSRIRVCAAPRAEISGAGGAGGASSATLRGRRRLSRRKLHQRRLSWASLAVLASTAGSGCRIAQREPALRQVEPPRPRLL